jgi:error-prone DNA polymerase
VVTHRQQPATAKGTVFLNLEDETGLVNVICAKGVWKRFRTVARGAPALRVRGVLEKHQGVINLVAGRITRLPISLADGLRSRDFQRARRARLRLRRARRNRATTVGL